MATTTIQIETEVREELRAIGRMGESYNDVIKRLLLATRHLDAVRLGGRGSAPTAGTQLWMPLRDRQ